MYLAVVAAICLSIVGLAHAGDAMAVVRKAMDIPAQGLGHALTTLAKEFDFQVLYRTEVVAGRMSNVVAGAVTAQEALEKVLSGTGLTYKYLDEKTVTILPVGDDRELSPETGQVPSTEIKSRRGAIMKFFLMGTTILAGSLAQAAAEVDSAPALEEITVTATRREQSAQDVAGGLQVFGGEELERTGVSQFSDYLLSVPNVSFRDQGGGSKRVSLRGVSNFAASDSGAASPASTIGMYLNDISVADTSNVPDLATYDVARIEVLKGPQGTLYGEGAMGGAIKMILNSPDLSRYEGRAETTLSNTESGGFNYQVRGMANLPLATDQLGLRLVGSYEDRDGYTDNVATGEDNFNGSSGYSIRGTLLWQPTDQLSAELLGLRNVQDVDGTSQVDSRLADLEMATREDLYNETENDVLGLTVKYDLGFAGLTSISSYYSSQRERQIHLPALGPVFARFGTITQEPSASTSDLSSVSQELRLVSNGDQRLDWVVGAFYRDKEQDSRSHFYFVPADVASVNAGLAAAGRPLIPASGTIFDTYTKDGYEQYAVYGEVNFELLDRLELIGGLRWFEEEVTYLGETVGYSLLASASATVPGGIKEDSVVPKFGLSYKFSDDHQIYAQAAKGFRSGVVNTSRAFQVGDEGAGSDSLWSYELGAKTSWADHRLRVNGSLYYVDWKDVQTRVTATSPVTGSSYGFMENGGDAELIGAELELIGAPIQGLLLGLSGGYTHSEMVRVAATNAALLGSELPSVPEWTASGFFEYRGSAPVVANSTGFLRFEVQYSDEQAMLPITATSDGNFVDSYSLGKLQLGLEADRWSATIFVDNLWDERAQFGRGTTGTGPLVNPDFITVARPRTYGLRVSTAF